MPAGFPELLDCHQSASLRSLLLLQAICSIMCMTSRYEAAATVPLCFSTMLLMAHCALIPHLWLVQSTTCCQQYVSIYTSQGV